MLQDALAQLVRRRWGAAARLEDLQEFEEGHAGRTYGFIVGQPGRREERFVLKMAAEGVARRGSNDLYRQAHLLRTLCAAGLPAPDVPAAASDETDLGAPFIVMERLPGRTFIVWEPHASFDRSRAAVAPLWRQAADALAQIHRYDWRSGLAGWEQPRSAADELAAWNATLQKATEPRWVTAGAALAQRLTEAIPSSGPVGLVHGDFQPGNLVFERGELQGVIDWDLAGIGPQGLDLGWLLMMNDPECWDRDWQPHSAVPGGDLLDRYFAAGGPEMGGIPWYQALACYRMGAIAGLNLRLHRSGRRPDEMWERFASSIDTLFRRGHGLLDGAPIN